MLRKVARVSAEYLRVKFVVLSSRDDNDHIAIHEVGERGLFRGSHRDDSGEGVGSIFGSLRDEELGYAWCKVRESSVGGGGRVVEGKEYCERGFCRGLPPDSEDYVRVTYSPANALSAMAASDSLEGDC